MLNNYGKSKRNMTTKEVMEKYDKKYGFKAVIYY